VDDVSTNDVGGRRVLDQLSTLRRHQLDGRRSPHRPLLVLLALGRPAASGSAVGIEAAHLRWFTQGGPDERDDDRARVVSQRFSVRTHVFQGAGLAA
jgi:hypothetical protein